MNTHISYKTSKALKEFCPELPEPMDGSYQGIHCVFTKFQHEKTDIIKRFRLVPAYQLHDLLSRPFCEALASTLYKRYGQEHVTASAEGHFQNLAMEWWSGGLPAVEACLMKMIGGK